MAAKCAYVEKVGAVYYVRKRIPRAWGGRVMGEVLRLSLRTKDRAKALMLGLEALAVFEDLLRMEPEDALKHLTRRLIDEQLLRPDDMTGADLVRRRALGHVGAKIIRQAREEMRLGEHLDGIYQELVHFNHATVQGEAIHDRKADSGGSKVTAGRSLDVSGVEAVLDALGARPPEDKPTVALLSTPPPALLVEPAGAGGSAGDQNVVQTLRYVMGDYFKKIGKNTGSDNRANIERAVRMFEDLCPAVKTLAVPDIPLRLWDELHEFVQEIPEMRGRSTPSNLVAFTRDMQAKGANYPKLKANTLNSNYLGAITRLVRHGNKRRLFSYQSPMLVVAESKRATKGTHKAPFSSEEITAITSCPVYLGSASRHHRYSPGKEIFADDHVYWAPLVSMHTGMRVTEIGMLRFEQMQTWFGRQTLVLEFEEDDGTAEGEEGYKTGSAIRRVPIHPQLVDIGFLDFWNRQQELGCKRPFPDWTQHIKGGKDDRPEVHFEADFFNAHRLKWGVPAARARKLTFHSLRGFFIQACHDARIDSYTILKYVGHDEETETKTSSVHRNYMNKDLTRDDVGEIDKVVVPLGPVTSFGDWLRQRKV